MSNIYFSSDHHFFHKNIIKYCNRPFHTVDEMNSFMIAKWNEVVKPQDIVYYLGDFAFARYEQILPIFNSLNGTKVLSSIGNHDGGSIKQLPWVSKHKNSSFFNTDWHYMSHFPDDIISEFDRCKYKYKYYFHGHCHNTLPNTSKKIDVGVDCWNYAPVSFEQLEAKMKATVDPNH